MTSGGGLAIGQVNMVDTCIGAGTGCSVSTTLLSVGVDGLGGHSIVQSPGVDQDGRGLAAADMDGHLLWSSLSSVPLRVQAFADGSLAIVRGNELQIVASDGTITRSFRAPDELTTYPAIASDG